MCPLGREGRGSGSVPPKRPGERASTIWRGREGGREGRRGKGRGGEGRGGEGREGFGGKEGGREGGREGRGGEGRGGKGLEGRREGGKEGGREGGKEITKGGLYERATHPQIIPTQFQFEALPFFTCFCLLASSCRICCVL